MSARRLGFVDTNVLVYLLSTDLRKLDRVEELLDRELIVSIQVISEFTAVARRKFNARWDQIDEIIRTVRILWKVEPLTLDSYDGARRIAERYQIAWYDALIAASAIEAGCSTLYSEDFQQGRSIDGKIKVINPFM